MTLMLNHNETKESNKTSASLWQLAEIELGQAGFKCGSYQI